MRKIFCSIILLLCGLFSCKQAAKKVDKPTVKIDSVTVTSLTSQYTDLKGNAVALNDYEGKKVLLNFWATWCRPCIEEMPALERAKTLLQKENYVFLLASDQSVDKINKFKNRTDFKLDFIHYTGELSQLKIYALPTTFIFNEHGEKVFEITGTTAWDSPEMILKLKQIK